MKHLKIVCSTIIFSIILQIGLAQSCNSYEPNNSTTSATDFFGYNLSTNTSNDTRRSLITFDDQDWYVLRLDFTGTLTIRLSDLPANFDIELYGFSGLNNFLRGSYKSGTNTEDITYTYSTPQSTLLYIKVYGYNLSFNNTSCYTLSVDWEPTCPLTNTPPILTSPGNSVGPGTALSDLTPRLTWQATPYATNYDVFMTDLTTGQLILEDNCGSNTTYYDIPENLLGPGKFYRWNIQANRNCGTCESVYSSRLYFYTTGGCSPPSVQASGLNFSDILSDRVTVRWNHGNGTNRLVKINTVNSFLDPPVGFNPTSNSTYSNAGEQVIYNGSSGNSITVTGLTSATNYYFKIYESNCSSGSRIYNTNNSSQNPNSVLTTGSCVSPIIVSQPNSSDWCENQSPFINVYATGSSLLYQWQKKDGGNYLDISGENSYQLSVTTNGIYRCEISNGCGNITSEDATVSILPCSGLVANFNASSLSIIAGQSVSFTDLSLNASGASRAWKIDRQQTSGLTTNYSQSNILNPTIQFSFPGCYKISLTVTNSSESNTKSVPCYIKVAPNLNNPVNSNIVNAYNYPVGYCGDPVNTATGAFVFSMKDLAVFSLGKEIEIERRYVSSNNSVGYFGKGWSSFFDTKLVLSNPYQWEVHHSDGHISYHIPYSDGETRSLYPGNTDSLYYTGQPGSYSYIYKQQDGTKIHFTSTGKLDKIIDVNGNAVQFNYNGGNISEMVTPSGRSFLISSNTNKRIVQIADPSGRIAYYHYSGVSDQQLDSVRVETSKTSFRYNSDGLTEIYDPNGNSVVKVVYNPSTKKVFRQYDAFDLITNFEYLAGKTVVTDPLQGKKNFTYDPQLRLTESENELSRKRIFSYNSNSQLASFTNEKNNTINYFYDNNNNIIKTIDPTGNFDTSSYTINSKPDYFKDALGNEYHFSYDGNSNPTTYFFPNGGEVNVYYDERGLDTLTLDAKGNSIHKSFAANGDLQQIKTLSGKTVFAYDANGRVIAITNEVGNIDSFTYNHLDQIRLIKDPLGYRETFVYDNNGNLLSNTDKEGNRKEYEYDAKDRLTKIIESYNHVTSFEYDALDRMIKKRDANGNVLLFTYDIAGQLTTVSDSLLGVLVSNEYDQAGNLIVTRDHAGKSNRTEYDSRNLPVSYIDAINDTTAIEYNENLQIRKIKDAEGKITTYGYDKMGLQNQITDAVGNTVTIHHDLNGNIDTIVDAKGNIRSWKYDQTNRPIKSNDGFGDYLYTYDSAGRIIRFDDLVSNSLVYTYSKNNELLQVSDQSGIIKNFMYSPNGWVKRASNPAGHIMYSYDELGRLLSKADPHNDSLSYTYDSVGNIASLRSGGNRLVKYSYNSINAPVKVTDWNNQQYVLFRNVNGILDSVMYPNGAKATINYDDAYQITSWKNYSSGISPPFHENLLVRDKNGFIVKDSGIKVAAPVYADLSTSSTFDIDDRIITAGESLHEHDPNGARTKTLSSNDSSTFNYDSQGNLIRYQYNSNQHLYTYDALDQRIQKNTSINVIQYDIDNLFTDHPLVISESNPNLNTSITNIYTPDGILLARDSSSNWIYYHHDVYGNTIALSTDSGSTSDSYAYGAFGESFKHYGTSTQPYTWLGKYGVQQDDSVLHYVWARYYDASNGRFLSKDPYPFNYNSTQDINRYVYGLNNPLFYIDPTGYKAVNNTSEYFPHLQQTYISSPKISVLDFVPVVGGARDIYWGIQNNSWAQVGLGVGSIILDIGSAGQSTVAKGLIKASVKGSRNLTFYRAMSNVEYSALQINGGLSSMAGKELFISTSLEYSRSYLNRVGYDKLVEFKTTSNAINDMSKIGVRNGSGVVINSGLGNLPKVSKGWIQNGHNFFKGEKGVLNIGLGNSTSNFNKNIIRHSLIK